MNYKLEGAIRKNRKNFIIYALLWLIIAIIIVPLFTYCVYMAQSNGGFDLNTLRMTLEASITKPFSAFIQVFKNGIFGAYLTHLLIATVFFSIFFFIGFMKSAPKNEYTDIEHGSSDWSQHGEQYRILSKSKGIILAKDNYLPVDKRGNVNVLVVGRFRFW